MHTHCSTQEHASLSGKKVLEIGLWHIRNEFILNFRVILKYIRVYPYRVFSIVFCIVFLYCFLGFFVYPYIWFLLFYEFSFYYYMLLTWFSCPNAKMRFDRPGPRNPCRDTRKYHKYMTEA